MGTVIYNLAMTFFFIPLTIRACISLKNDRLLLPRFQNNIVVNRIKLQNAIGIWSPILFWVFHLCWLMWNLLIDAWLASNAHAARPRANVLSPLLCRRRTTLPGDPHPSSVLRR
ncbi:hypothetical protein ACJ7C5_08735 [Nocardiopsis yanglingensis]